MNLGELIDALKACDQTLTVRISAPVSLRPDGVESYRGYYEDLAIKVETGGYGSDTVADFLAMLEGAVGTTYEGYKGGDFTMGRNTRVWISNYGEASNALVTGVTREKWCITLNYEMSGG